MLSSVVTVPYFVRNLVGFILPMVIGWMTYFALASRLDNPK